MLSFGVTHVAEKDDLDLEDDFAMDDEGGNDAAEAQAETAKTNLTKRRVIDNMLEERRLKRQLAEYDYDL